ncbi:hypothetical protein [Acinetobacter baumannii]|uniref:hypothetical protein n=1 Tax=Acinetobacter baumannii TaxID=470 RepID=UPI0022B4A3B4|nr:hypothetical protein [Acinetobacter baumannii]
MLFSSAELGRLNLLKEMATLLNELSQTFNHDQITWANRLNVLVDVNIHEVLARAKKFIETVDIFFDFDKGAASFFISTVNLYNKELKESFALEEKDRAISIVNVLCGILAVLVVETSFFSYLRGNELKSEEVEFNKFNDFINKISTNGVHAIGIKNYPEEYISDKVDYSVVNKRVEKIEERLGRLEVNVAIEVQNILNDYSITYKEKIDQIIEDLNGYVANFKNKKLPNIDIDVETLNTDIGKTRLKLIGLVGSLNQYESIISENTENEISKHYSKKAKREKRAYWSATGISVVIILISLFSAWCGLNDYYHSFVIVDLSPENCKNFKDLKICAENIKLTREATEKFGLIYLIMRLIFSFFLFLTVIYTSRIAIRAYSHWRHSENMHLKLASLRPFINDLAPSDIEQIHKDLVPDYFGKDAGIVETNNEKLKDFPTNMSAIAIKAIEQFSGSGSNSSTEKNGKKPEGGTE